MEKQLVKLQIQNILQLAKLAIIWVNFAKKFQGEKMIPIFKSETYKQLYILSYYYKFCVSAHLLHELTNLLGLHTKARILCLDSF
jgi:hypothetical protein